MPSTKPLWKHKHKKKKKKGTFFLVHPIRSDPETQQPTLESSCPLPSRSPRVLLCGRQWQLTGTNSCAPGLPGTWAHRALWAAREISPEKKGALATLPGKGSREQSRAGRGSAAAAALSCRAGQCHAAGAQPPLPAPRGSIPSCSASDSSPTALARGIALHYIAFPARRHCCITVQSSSNM